MKRNKLTMIITALCTTALSGAVIADCGDKTAFHTLDADNNGQLSKAEIQAAKDIEFNDRLTAEWSALDSNQDGKLDRTEYAEFEAELDAEATVNFAELDADSDGNLTRIEIQSAQDIAVNENLTDQWSELDTNQDGKLDRAEFARFEPVMHSDEKAKQHAAEGSAVNPKDDTYEMEGEEYDTDDEDY